MTAVNESNVERIINALKTSDGAGVTLKRTIGSSQLPDLDPFLLLDEFKSDDPNDYIAGFPNHPHRGFETVTYMLAGKMEHKDHTGSQGIIEPGGVQWMTAGKGIIHSEMPIQENGLMWGFQLWVNLPSDQKLKAPRYQNIEPSEIPEIEIDKQTKIKVIAGKSHNKEGAVKDIDINPLFIDVHLKPNTRFTHPLESTHNTFLYLYQGSMAVGSDKSHQSVINQGQLAVLSKGTHLTVESNGDIESRFIIVSGKPIKQPIVKYGPFVMNTEDEIQQAIRDFQNGRFVD